MAALVAVVVAAAAVATVVLLPSKAEPQGQRQPVTAAGDKDRDQSSGEETEEPTSEAEWSTGGPAAKPSTPTAVPTTKTTTTTAAALDVQIHAGLAFDTGGRGDGTFNDLAGQGAERAGIELGVTLTEVEASSDDDRVPNLSLLAGQGLDPIIAVGFLWSDTLAGIAAAHPDTTFAIVDGYVDAPNVKNLGFAENEGSFLVGAAAALKSADGRIGFIGGQEGALIKRFEVGYVAGAKAVNPNIEVKVQYLGPEGDNTAWNSPEKAKVIAQTWYGEGVDVIYSAAGGSGQGTIEAAIEAGEGKWAIGVDSDQYLTATPEAQKVILTSMIKRVDEAVFQTIETATTGSWADLPEVFDLSVDGVDYSTSGGYIDEFIPQLEELKAQIIAGTITVPRQ